jgi:hypothetical protein
MARYLMIAVGAVLWGTFAVAATYLFLIGHWVAPTVALMVGVPLLTVRLRLRLSPARARTTGQLSGDRFR